MSTTGELLVAHLHDAHDLLPAAWQNIAQLASAHAYWHIHGTTAHEREPYHAVLADYDQVPIQRTIGQVIGDMERRLTE